MPCAIPEFKREVIKVKIKLKQHNKSIANDTSVSERTIRAYKKNLRDHGTLCPPKAVLQGRHRKITPKMQEVCVNTYQRCCQKLMISCSLILLCTHPSLYVDKQVYHLWDAFSVQVDEQCIKR